MICANFQNKNSLQKSSLALVHPAVGLLVSPSEEADGLGQWHWGRANGTPSASPVLAIVALLGKDLGHCGCRLVIHEWGRNRAIGVEENLQEWQI
jgi:hypothetical protein